MAEINIPLCRVPEEPYSQETAKCYLDRCIDYQELVQDCIDAGGGDAAVQACINQKFTTYLQSLEVCDLM